MDQDEVLVRLEGIFQEVLDTDDIEMSRELSAGDVEEWNSLSHIRLIVSVEQAFDVSFRSTEVNNLDNVGDMVDLILEKLG